MARMVRFCFLIGRLIQNFSQCDEMGDCVWHNKGKEALEFIHCVPPGAIRRDEHGDASDLQLLDFGIDGK